MINCTGNSNKQNKCRAFRLSKDGNARQSLVDTIHDFLYGVPFEKLFLCERHWPDEKDMNAVPGKFTRPCWPPNLFDIPPSMLQGFS